MMSASERRPPKPCSAHCSPDTQAGLFLVIVGRVVELTQDYQLVSKSCIGSYDGTIDGLLSPASV